MKIKKTPYTLFLFLTCFLAVSCFKDDDDNISVSTNQLNDFVWKGMNSWYYWQNNVGNLNDTKDDDTSTYNSYLNQYTNPEEFFNSLRYDYGTSDRFSWFIEDYIVQEQQFQGISKSFGLEFQGVQINNEGDIIIYIKYVVENSPASEANITRGNIITAINGTALNTSNYNNNVTNLFEDTVTLTFATENNGTLTPTDDKSLTARVITENPVHLKKIFDIDGQKVGYLLYNSFSSSYNDELNDAFAYFKSEHIDQLILDLRLNGGGSVLTSAYLASMINATPSTNQDFAQLIFNDKHENENGSYPFFNTLNVYNANGNKTDEQDINRLNTLSQLYVLTSGRTASASEMIINGLRAYMDVKLIGETTYGKNVGSITLYDSPTTDYQNKSSANPNHLYAMQPIVFKIYNKNGESNYTQGFSPDIEIFEHQYWNSILPFGDENEVVLKTALDDIKGLSNKILFKRQTNSKLLKTPKNPKNKFDTDMYINNTFFN